MCNIFNFTVILLCLKESYIIAVLDIVFFQAFKRLHYILATPLKIRCKFVENRTVLVEHVNLSHIFRVFNFAF